jgi:hypothetical protein
LSIRLSYDDHMSGLFAAPEGVTQPDGTDQHLRQVFSDFLISDIAFTSSPAATVLHSPE